MSKHNTVQALGEWITTADATVTDISTFTTAPSKMYQITARVQAINQDLTQGAAYRRTAAFITNAAGTLVQIGATTAVESLESNAAWDCTLDASGKDIRVRATGAAITNINWRADVDINEVGIGPGAS
jgi:hypothetical protein